MGGELIGLVAVILGMGVPSAHCIRIIGYASFAVKSGSRRLPAG